MCNASVVLEGTINYLVLLEPTVEAWSSLRFSSVLVLGIRQSSIQRRLAPSKELLKFEGWVSGGKILMLFCCLIALCHFLPNSSDNLVFIFLITSNWVCLLLTSGIPSSIRSIGDVYKLISKFKPL